MLIHRKWVQPYNDVEFGNYAFNEDEFTDKMVNAVRRHIHDNIIYSCSFDATSQVVDELEPHVKQFSKWLFWKPVNYVAVEYERGGRRYIATNINLEMHPSRMTDGVFQFFIIDLYGGAVYTVGRPLSLDFRMEPSDFIPAFFLRYRSLIESKLADLISRKAKESVRCWGDLKKLKDGVLDRKMLGVGASLLMATADDEAIEHVISEAGHFTNEGYARADTTIQLMNMIGVPYETAKGFFLARASSVKKVDGTTYMLLLHKETTSEWMARDKTNVTVEVVKDDGSKLEPALMIEFVDSDPRIYKDLKEMFDSMPIDKFLGFGDVLNEVMLFYVKTTKYLRKLIENYDPSKKVAVAEADGGTIVFTVIKAKPYFSLYVVLAVKDGKVGINNVTDFLEYASLDGFIEENSFENYIRHFGEDVAKATLDGIMSDPTVAGLLPQETVTKLFDLYADLALQ